MAVPVSGARLTGTHVVTCPPALVVNATWAADGKTFQRFGDRTFTTVPVTS